MSNNNYGNLNLNPSDPNSFVHPDNRYKSAVESDWSKPSLVTQMAMHQLSGETGPAPSWGNEPYFPQDPKYNPRSWFQPNPPNQ
jgi:hypothetical protein